MEENKIDIDSWETAENMCGLFGVSFYTLPRDHVRVEWISGEARFIYNKNDKGVLEMFSNHFDYYTLRRPILVNEQRLKRARKNSLRKQK